ncbi:hypothetical protein [Nonomuraea roseola]|uniref:DUF992 domain-containing protein n=1 Tax=Nonomuraea roseola TaxID=46179 RepID=A0ABV5PW98_9ACTN
MRFIVAAAAAMTILIPAAPAAADPLAGEPDTVCSIVAGTSSLGNFLGNLFKCPETNGSGKKGEASLSE